MNRRLEYFLQGDSQSIPSTQLGQAPIYTGTLDSEKAKYGLFESSDASLVATFRPKCDSRNYDGKSTGIGPLAIEQGTSNLLETTYNQDSLQLSNWNWFSNPTGNSVTVDYTDGPWGPLGPKASLIKATSGTSPTFYYSTGSTSVVGKTYTNSVYIKVISGNLIVKANGSPLGTQYTSASGWVRAEHYLEGNGGSSVQIIFQTQAAGQSVKFLACCAQIEEWNSGTTLWTSYVGPVDSTTPPGTKGVRPSGNYEIDSKYLADVSNFTFSTWFAPHEVTRTVGTNGFIFSIGGSNTTGDRFVFYRNSSSDLNLIIIPPAAIANNISTSWNNKEWHFIEVVSNKGSVQYFEDGIATGTPITGAANIFSDNIKLNIGSNYDSNGLANALFEDISFFNTPLLPSESLLLAQKTSPAYSDLDSLEVPQPTVSMSSKDLIPAISFNTVSGRTIVHTTTSASAESVSVHWGPLVENEVYLIKDFYDANGSSGTFWFTPPNGARKQYRFDNKKGLSIKTSRPDLHNVSADLIPV